MERLFPNNYADARLIHGSARDSVVEDSSLPPGELRLELRLTEPEIPAVVDYIESIPALERVEVRIIQVPLSLAELERLAADVVVPAGKKIEFDFDAGAVVLVDIPEHTLEPASCSLSSSQGGKLDGARPLRVYGNNCAD